MSTSPPPSDYTLYVLLGVCTLAVAIGVAFEFVEDWQKAKEKREWNERNPWSPIVPKVGFVLLVVGLAGEIVFQVWLEQRDTTFKTDAARAITNADSRATSAEQHATESNGFAAHASELAANATERAIRLLRMESNRELTDDGSDQFENLAKFKGVPIWVEPQLSLLKNWSEWREPENFAASFINLRQVGWQTPIILNQHDPKRFDIPGGPVVVNVTVYSQFPKGDNNFRGSPDALLLDSPDKEEWATAEALKLYIDSSGCGPARHWPISDVRRMLPKGFPSDGILVMIGEHDVQSALAKEKRSLQEQIRQERRDELTGQ
jgi:hypothetical protein